MKKGLLVFALVMGLSAVVGISAVAAQDDWRFGIVEAYEAPNSAAALRVSWTRIRFQWATVQPDGPDAWTPEVDDALIEQELAAGRELVGLLIGIPDWARDENKLPSGLWLPDDDPANTWATFVREVVGRYDGQIDHWIIWNEPDIDATEIAHTWDGSVADFAQLQKVAYRVAKETNPNATVHLSAFTYWADEQAGRDQYMGRLLDELLADPDAFAHNIYFDIATAHLYFQPDQIYELIGFFRQEMTSRGIDKPLWLVETNAPPINDPDWPVEDWTLSVMETEQAAFMPQAVAAAFAAGAERVSVYKMQDTAEDRAANPEPFGLVRRDGSRRVAFRTYEHAIKYLSGFSAVTRDRWDEVGQYTFEQADRTTTMLFARLPWPQSAEIPATSSQALLVDMWGQTQEIIPQNGIYNIELQSPQCTQPIGDFCMIGGTVYYLIQARDGFSLLYDAAPAVEPTATLPATATPSPTPTATPTLVLTATPQPTATPTATATLLPQPTSTTPIDNAPQTDTAEISAVSQPPTMWWVAGTLGFLLIGGVGFWIWRRE